MNTVLGHSSEGVEAVAVVENGLHVTYWLGSLVVKAPFMKWGNPGFESWSGHFMHFNRL